MGSESGGIELTFTELSVADWPAAVRWYVEVLGLRMAVEDAAHQFALLDAGACRLSLKGGASSPAPGTPRGVRLTFRVQDVDAERDRLRRLGLEVGAPRDNLAEGYRKVSLHDSEGTPITLFSWLEARAGTG